MDNIKDCLVGGTPETRAMWHTICDEMKQKKADWIAELREQGFKAAHPNDGWVDREKNIISFCYPQFDDGVEVGSKVMLGWPGERGRLRPIRLVEFIPGAFSPGGWRFEDLKEGG